MLSPCSLVNPWAGFKAFCDDPILLLYALTTHPPAASHTHTHVRENTHSQVFHWIMFSCSPLPPCLCMCCSLYLWCSIHFLPEGEILIHPLGADTSSSENSSNLWLFSHSYQVWVACLKQMLLLADSVCPWVLPKGFLWWLDHPLP